MGRILNFASVLLLSVVCVVSGLKCHVCNSIIQSGCGKNFEGSYAETCPESANGCWKYQHLNTVFGDLVMRGCSNDTNAPGCIDISSDMSACKCVQDLCNNVGTVYADKFVVLMSTAILIFAILLY